MKNLKLDRINLRILWQLQKDGRITNVALTDRAGISPPPCLRRVQSLEFGGYIRGYYADIAGDKLGFNITAFVLVFLANHTKPDLQNFAKLANTWPEVRESYMNAGDADFLLKVATTDLDALQRFLTDKVKEAPNVSEIRTIPVGERTKYQPGIPIEFSLAAPARPEPNSGATPRQNGSDHGL